MRGAGFQRAANRKSAERTNFAAWVDAYDLAHRERRVRVSDGSPLVGKTLADLNLRGTSGANILAVERRGRFANEVLRPTASTELQAGDILLIDLATSNINFQRMLSTMELEDLPLNWRLLRGSNAGAWDGRGDRPAHVGAGRQDDPSRWS